ncbi:MAG: glutaminyl-peptide cyclotransferase [Acidimicrobiia bacterium]
MKKRLLVFVVGAFVSCAPAMIAQRKPAPVQGFKVIATYPHDPDAFTQGLVFAGGEFYESTGLNNHSTLRRVEIATGKVLQQHKVPDEYFAEGLALVGDELLQLTWQHRRGFVYDRKTFALKRTFPYKTEGWGIAYDRDSQLEISDGSDSLKFLNPKTHEPTKSIRVRDAGRSIDHLNELEWIEGEIWANVWLTDRVARISPVTGEVNAWVDFSSLWPSSQRPNPGDQVLNGIAYDGATRRIFITGTQWPRLYHVSVL